MSKWNKGVREIWNSEQRLEDCTEFVEEECAGCSETEQYARIYEMNDELLEDERANFRVISVGDVIVIARIGVWNGIINGYKYLHGTLANVLYSDADEAHWFVDSHGDLICMEYHHDGHNMLLYREFKDNVSDLQRELFTKKILDGTVKRCDITKYTTRLGDKIANLYGW